MHSTPARPSTRCSNQVHSTTNSSKHPYGTLGNPNLLRGGPSAGRIAATAHGHQDCPSTSLHQLLANSSGPPPMNEMQVRGPHLRDSTQERPLHATRLRDPQQEGPLHELHLRGPQQESPGPMLHPRGPQQEGPMNEVQLRDPQLESPEYAPCQASPCTTTLSSTCLQILQQHGLHDTEGRPHGDSREGQLHDRQPHGVHHRASNASLALQPAWHSTPHGAPQAPSQQAATTAAATQQQELAAPGRMEWHSRPDGTPGRIKSAAPEHPQLAPGPT